MVPTAASVVSGRPFPWSHPPPPALASLLLPFFVDLWASWTSMQKPVIAVTIPIPPCETRVLPVPIMTWKWGVTEQSTWEGLSFQLISYCILKLVWEVLYSVFLSCSPLPQPLPSHPMPFRPTLSPATSNYSSLCCPLFLEVWPSTEAWLTYQKQHLFAFIHCWIFPYFLFEIFFLVQYILIMVSSSATSPASPRSPDLSTQLHVLKTKQKQTKQKMKIKTSKKKFPIEEKLPNQKEKSAK